MDAAHPGRRDMVDGNAAGGYLLELFGRDMTGAITTCAQCANEAPVADAVAELDESGVILICRGCGHTLLTYLKTDDRQVFTIGALARLEWGEREA